MNGELKTIRRGVAAGGAVLAGGGALLPGAVDINEATSVCRCNWIPESLGGILDQVDTPQFATVVGLLLLAQSNHWQTYFTEIGWYCTEG